MMLTGKKTFTFQHSEEDVDNYVEQVWKQVISVHEQVCKRRVTGVLQDNVNSKIM